MLGEWRAETPDSVTVDRWQRISDDTWEGSGETRKSAGGEVMHRESLRLVAMSAQVFFLAKTPGNTRPVAFEAIECSANRVVFENRDHDFPNRLDYRLVDENALHVDVVGNDGKGFTVEYRRIDEQNAN